VVLPKQVNGFMYIFNSLPGETLMMVASMTETLWSLAVCDKIHFTKVNSFIYYTLELEEIWMRVIVA
jgi:hypothetical protein